MAHDTRHGGSSPKTVQPGSNRDSRDPDINLNSIRFTPPLDPELFNSHAHTAARAVAKGDRLRNKSTQLRRFYDEIVSWEGRVNQQQDKFAEYLPYIRMLNAKAAYAEGRKLVDQTFLKLLHHTLNEATDPISLAACKSFWEAFMGFYKQERPE